MKTSSIILCCVAAACGGGGASQSSSAGTVVASNNSSVTADPSVPSTNGGGSIVNPVGPPPVVNAAVTSLNFQSTGVDQTNASVTFGQVFAAGDVPAGQNLAGKFADGSTLALQVNAKATYPDGSLRHAVISALLPSLPAGQTLKMDLGKTSTVASTATISPTALLNAGFTSNVNITIGGQAYTVSADALLRAGKYTSWLSGPLVNEWLLEAPLKTAAGAEHPQLTAHFAIRNYAGSNQTRVDVIVENDWAYEVGPQNYTYDVQVNVGGKAVYTKAGLKHYHHARWRKTFWWGNEPQVFVQHNAAYMIASKALVNYDQNVTFSATALSDFATNYANAKKEPMENGLALPAMGTTGGRPDIGLMPAWASTYLLSMDKTARDATLKTADLAGTWSAHFRDKKTGRPLSIIDYPFTTILGQIGDSYNPVTKQYEKLTMCDGTDCNNPHTPDTSHQPNFSYLPYLVTGDHYYLEELQFWATMTLVSFNPEYRNFEQGILFASEVRGQAWGLRTLAEAAFITPDQHPLKQQFIDIVNNNLDWYNVHYTNNTVTTDRFYNALGFVTEPGVYNPAVNAQGVSVDRVGADPWMDDFFTSAVGHTLELGFTKALPLLKWKVKFPIGRMVAPGFCWISASSYNLTMRDSATSPFYTTMAQVYQATKYDLASLPCAGSAMATKLGLKVGEMLGYDGGNTGYPSNLQPALAFGADVGGAEGLAAWQLFMKRPFKPDYGLGPQFDIVPRQ